MDTQAGDANVVTVNLQECVERRAYGPQFRTEKRPAAISANRYTFSNLYRRIIFEVNGDAWV